MSLTRVKNITANTTVTGDVNITGVLTTTSTGTTLSSNTYNVVKIQTDKDDTAAADGLLQFTHGSANTVKGEIRYDASESMFEIGHGDNQGHLRINTNGHVTMPYQPAFDVAQPAQVSGDHTFSQIHLNRGSHYNNSNGRFTAPVAGVYVFNFGGIKNGNSTTTVRLYIKKNGSRLYSERHLRLDGGQVDTYGDNGSVQWIAELAVNDYIQAETGAGSIYNATGEYTTFSGFLVG